MDHGLKHFSANILSSIRNHQVCGGLVERDDAAVGAERLGEGEADDEGGEDLLAGGAPAAHLHLRVVLDHHHLEF